MTNENVPPAPTVVIGVGEAGIKAMAALHDLVKGEGEQDYFKFVAIDSHGKSLDDNTRNIITERIYLETPAAYIDRDKSECFYLYQGVDIPEDGVSRHRVVGRYLIDNEVNFHRVNDTLRDVINEFGVRHQESLSDEARSMNIWLLHSLGGGTGSGTFPLLVALIQRMTKEIHTRQGIGFSIGGVGCLPSMVEDPELQCLKGNPKYYANAFAAMRELEKIMSATESHPLKIDIYSINRSINIEKSPFDKYFLVGINEDAITNIKEEWIETYIEQKNNLIANCIYSVLKYKPDLGNWHKSKILGTFGERELGVQNNKVKKYVDSKAECSKLTNEIKQNEEELKEKKEELKKLEDVVLNPYDISDEIKKIVDARINKEVPDQNLAGRSEADLETFYRNVAVEGLEGAVYAVELLKVRFKETRYQPLWEKKVNDLWTQYAMQSRGNEYQTAQSVADKHELLMQFIERRIIEDTNWIGNPPTIHLPGAERGRKNRLNEFRNVRTGLQRAMDDLDRIIDLQGTISELKNDITTEIGVKINTLQSERKDIDSKKSQNEDKLKSEKSRCSSIESGLSTYKFGRVGFLEMNDLAKLTESRLEGMSSFNDFIDNGFVKREKVDSALKKQAERAKKWSDLTEKVTSKGNTRSQDEALILYSSENEELVTNLPDSVRRLYDETNNVIMNDPYMIKICAYKLGIDINNVRDYATLWDWYKKGELAYRVKMDDPVGEIFAYPEFFPDDENVKAVFKKIPVVTGSKSTEQPKKEGKPQSHIATKKITDSGRLLVDGSNVAWEPKKDGKPNIDNIEIIRLELEKEGYNNPIILVDANLRHKISEGDKERFKAWIDEGKVIQSPAQIKADETILKFADKDEEELKIVSNDTFRGYEKQYPWLNDLSRRVPFKIIEDQAVLHFR